MRTLVVLLAALLTSPLQAQESARDIVDRVDRLLRGESSHGTVTMEVETADWSRSLDLEIWSLGTEYALVRVLAPPKDAGTATLKSGNDLWNYLPRARPAHGVRLRGGLLLTVRGQGRG